MGRRTWVWVFSQFPGSFRCCGGGVFLMFLCVYPLLRVLLITVSPLRRGTFSKRRKSTQKGLLLRSALAGSGSFAAGLIRAQRLRFASLHLLPLCSTASNGRCAPTPGSIPPLSLPTSPVDQDQEHSSLRSLLSGAASPRAVALLCFCFCGSEPAREGGLTADLSLSVTRSNCRSRRRLRSFDLAFAFDLLPLRQASLWDRSGCGSAATVRRSRTSGSVSRWSDTAHRCTRSNGYATVPSLNAH